MSTFDPRSTFQEGMEFHKRGDLGRAERFYKRVLKRHPDQPEVTAMMGRLLIDRKQEQRGLHMMKRALDSAPKSATIHLWYGMALLDLGREEQAIAMLKDAVALSPREPELRFLYGGALLACAEVEAGLEQIQHAVVLNPENEQYRAALATALSRSGRIPVDLSHVRWLVARAPQRAEYRVQYGNSLQINSLLDEAEAEYRRALELSPEMPEAHHGLAQIEESRGQNEQAYQRLKQLLEAGHSSVAMAKSFARSCRRRGTPAEARTLLETLRRNPRLNRDQRIGVLHSLGQLYEDEGRIDEAWECYAGANDLRPPTWDGEEHRRGIDRLISVFSPGAFGRLARARNTDETPVFIVGMFRSGTTLLEQILACHPQVYAAGELADVHAVAISLDSIIGATEEYPDCLPKLTADMATDIADAHLRKLRSKGGSANRVTDKFPLNYLHLGFIHLLFPAATIINTVRDPLDTCLSCYATSFASVQGFTTNLSELGRTYRQYERIMAHWRQVLPIPVLQVSYERLVGNLEEVTREILDHCGLPWDEGCLRFHESKRVVRTPSEAQVKQPIFRTSIGRATRFKAFLGPLEEALNGSATEEPGIQSREYPV